MSSTKQPTTPSVPSTPPSSACCSVMGNNSAAAASSALLFILNEELKNNNLLLCDQTSNLVKSNAALTQEQVRDAQRSANEAAKATRSQAKQTMISGAFSIGSAVVGAGVYAHGTLPTNEESGITRLQRQQNAPSTSSSVTTAPSTPQAPATAEQQATIEKWKNGDFTDAHKLTDAQMQEHIQVIRQEDKATFATQLQTPVSQLGTMADARMRGTQMKSTILQEGIGGISSLSQSQEKLNNELVDTQNSKMDEIQSDLLKSAQQQNQQVLSLITSTAQADVQTGQQALQALDKIIR